ncbi:hypothetical protein [Specibacter cremeus]|uniref:hypothetical protein n=1 Tax=Specibacter cremeus TaxID=1629051 RepID=UPI000F77FFDE|nr:hypothetical protein [Specibacter cremeus]
MSMAIGSQLASATLPSWNWSSGRAPENTSDATPIALDPTAPALREAFILFAETLEPIRDQETVRIVRRGDARYPTFISNSYVSGPMFVLMVGDPSKPFGTASQCDPETPDPLAVFERIQGELRVTQKDLFAATGIKRRTFYSWKDPSTPRPRPSSLGRLWHLADALEDLRETLDRPVAVWLHSSSERMTAFKAGHFEDLVDLAVAMPKPAEKTHGTSRRLGVASDVEVPIVRTGRPKVSVVERGVRR